MPSIPSSESESFNCRFLLTCFIFKVEQSQSLTMVAEIHTVHWIMIRFFTSQDRLLPDSGESLESPNVYLGIELNCFMLPHSSHRITLPCLKAREIQFCSCRLVLQWKSEFKDKAFRILNLLQAFKVMAPSTNDI